MPPFSTGQGPLVDSLEREQRWAVKRLTRTPQKKVIHGRVYLILDKLGDDLGQFVDRYKAPWLVEKNGFLSPNQAGEQGNAAMSIRSAT